MPASGRPLPASPRTQAFADAGRRSASYFATVPAGYLARQQSIRPASNGIISARSAVLAPSSTEPGGSDDSHAARLSQAARQVFKTVTHRH